jgi:glycosyltransferase involved in cell wall biosynthesis
MNIAFFSESYKPYLSGVTNSIETLKKGLEDLGHKVIVFSPSYPNSKKILDVHRFPSIPAPYPGYRITLPVPGMHYDVLKENKIDIIHSHSPYQLGLLSMYYAKRLNIPFIFTMHTVLGKYMHYIPVVPQKLSETLMNKYSSWFCNRSKCVVVPTKKVMEFLRSIGISARIEVIPTGMDISLIEKADPSGIREIYGIPKEAKILLFVGRLAKEKNLEFLFKAFEKVRSQYNNVFLLIAARGPMEKEYKKTAPKNTIFAGQISYPRVFDYYAASDIFVFSSLSETQGLVLAEAMASGIPQVAVSAEGVSDVVKDGITGYLTPLDIEIFSEKTIKILKNKDLWNKMSMASKEIARTIYSKEAFARKIELLYRSVL